MVDLSQFDAAELDVRMRNHLVIGDDGHWLMSGLWHDKNGYPILCVGRHRLRCSRIAYHLWVGPIPPDLLALHTCDRPVCVHPAHLYVGTVADNARDREARHRRTVLAQRRAEAHGQLTLFGPAADLPAPPDVPARVA